MKLIPILVAAAGLTLAGVAPAFAQLDPFHWLDGATVSITTGNTSANIALAKMPTGRTQVRLASNCATWMNARKGASSGAVATTADLPIAPGEIEVLTIDNEPNAPITYMAMISPAGSCTLYVTTGSGS
jgi:hypothetical protein